MRCPLSPDGLVADFDDGHCAIRDSKSPTGPALIFTLTEQVNLAASGHCQARYTS